MAEEVADFEGLLDLLEEGFDAPSAAVEIADTGGGPVEVVGQEGHGDPFVIDLDSGGDAAQALRILGAGVGSDQSNLVVADDVAMGSFEPLAANVTLEVVLGPGDPEDAATGQVEEVGKVEVSLVEHGDLSGLEPCAQRHGSGVVMVGGLFDDGEGRKESLQVQPQMHFGGGLAAAVFGPVHAVGHQGDGRGINGMDRSLEAPGQAAVLTRRAEPWTKRLKMLQNAPEQFFHHVTVAMLVRIRERVAAWSNRPTDRAKFRFVVTKAVAYIVEPDRVGQLREQKTHYLAPFRESPALHVHAMLARQFFRQMWRDQFTNLM